VIAMHIQTVILCGGSGTRLWPLSRKNHLKQLLAGYHTIQHRAGLRLQGFQMDEVDNLSKPLFVENEEYRFFSAQQLKEIELDHAIILETPEAILVAEINHIKKIKEVVAQLKQQKHSERRSHHKVSRPWVGTTASILARSSRSHGLPSISAPASVCKCITTVPCIGSLSLEPQKSHLATKHCGYRKINPPISRSAPPTDYKKPSGKLPLEMIEVQSGSCLGEDDVVRFEDNHGRLENLGADPKRHPQLI
jgi:hypothetical protein